jgi:hypothetical protein
VTTIRCKKSPKSTLKLALCLPPEVRAEYPAQTILKEEISESEGVVKPSLR